MLRQWLAQVWANFCRLEVHVDPCGFAYYAPHREVAIREPAIIDIDQEWIRAEGLWSAESRRQGLGELF
jgi:hypothetical protein